MESSGKKLTRLFLAAFVALALASAVNAQTWTGNLSNDFNAAANWNAALGTNSTLIISTAGPQGNTTLTNATYTFTGTGGKISGVSTNMTITGGTLSFVNDTIDAISAGTANRSFTVGSNIVFGNGANATHYLNSNVADALLVVTGNITVGTGGTPGTPTLSLGSTSGKHGNYTISGNISQGGATGLTVNKRGNGTATLSGSNVITTLTSSESGRIVISGGTSTIGTINTTSATVIGGQPLEFTGGNTSVTAALNYGSANTTIRVSGGTVNLNMADGTGGWGSGLAGSIFRISGGTVNTVSGRAIDPSIVVDGGTLNFNTGASRFSFNNANSTLTLSSGNITVASGIAQGVRFGTTSGNAPNQTGAASFTGNQTGGNFTVFGNGGQTSGFSLGGNDTTNAMTIAYNLSGGLLDIRGTTNNNGSLFIGANATGAGSSVFTLSGNGSLIVRSSPGGSTNGVAGAQVGAVQVFALEGGTLATGRINAANLRASIAGTNGLLVNNGTNITPGGIGAAGRMVINGGNFTINSGTLSIEIGGLTIAGSSNFTESSGFYDNLRMDGAGGSSHTLTLGGRLALSFIDGFTPTASNAFDIIGSTSNTTATYLGNFSNVMTGVGGLDRVVLADGLSSFNMSINATASRVRISGFQSTNTYNASSGSSWNAANAGSWTVFDAGSTASPSTQASGAIADFADGAATSAGANVVNLTANRNIQGIKFSSTTSGKSYTLNGTGTLIFDNSANGAAATIADTTTANNTINLGASLNSNLTVTVQESAATLTMGGNISGSGTGLTKVGDGRLVLSGTNTFNGSTTIAAGTLAAASTGALGSTSSVTISGATLEIAAANAVNDSASITLANGTIAKGSGLINETFGALNLVSNSNVDFGSGTGSFTFATFNPSAFKLKFLNFNIGNSLSVTTGTFAASEFDFNSFEYTVTSGGGGFTITAIPEPSAIAAAAAFLGLAAFQGLRRRRNTRRGMLGAP